MRTLLAALLLSLAGCATQQSYQHHLDAWVGKRVDDLVIAWGPPQGTFPLSDGGQVMEWVEDRGATQLSTGMLTSTTTHSCRIRVTASSAGVVQRVGLEGNACLG